MWKFPEPIDAKRRDELVEDIAKKIEQYGMVVPAIFFLEMNKPLSYLGGQAMHFFSPIIGTFFSTFEDYAYFFEDRRNVEVLIQKLEALASKEDEKRRQDREAKKQRRAAKSAMLDEALMMEEQDKKADPENPPNP